MSKVLQAKEYRLANDIAPISYIIKTGQRGDLLVFDKKEGYNRAIRHCTNEKSIFVDEQSKFALLKAVVFEKGYLRTQEHDVVTQSFLDMHPDNTANGGKLFEEVNDEIEAAGAIEQEDLIVDLKHLVREKQKDKNTGLYELQALVSVLKDSYVQADSMSMPELRRELYRAIDKNPYRFKGEKGELVLFSEETKRKYLALKAIGEGVIKISPDGRSLIWGDNKNLITNIPLGRKATEELTNFLETDDGMLIIDKIVEEV